MSIQTLRVATRLAASFIAVLVIPSLAACGDDSGQNNNGVLRCANLACGDHGACQEAATGAWCLCDTGYRGTLCDQCDIGYVLEDGSCIEEVDPFFGTPTVDGNVAEGQGDWTAEQRVGHDDTASDWGPNTLTDLYVAYDSENLYLGVRGTVEAQNTLALYLDIDYGQGSQGLESIASASDNDGALDNSLSAAITVTDGQFRADWALGTKGMASADNVMDDSAGFRNIGLDSADFPWVLGRLIAGSAGFEASIPLASLFGGAPPDGARLALFARLVNEDGQQFANQTVPADNASVPATVSQVAVITLGSATSVCDDDGLCEAGETVQNCPGDCQAGCNNDGHCDPNETIQSCPEDCAGSGECGDPEVFQWEDAVMYFALVDRFFDSDSQHSEVSDAAWEAQYQGGDWAGVEAKLPYLASLGVNTLWLSAPYENRNSAGAAIDPLSDSHLYSAYHGYWPSPANIDYSNPDSPSPTPAVESRLGTASDLHSLIGSAHAEGMAVLFDYVMNHVDSESGLHAAHGSWFYTEGGNPVLCPPNNWNDPYYGTRCAFTSYLPAFDFYQPEVRQWSVADAIWWAKEFGIDGYRLDAIKHVPMTWLTELRTAVSSNFQTPTGGRFYLVGETYDYDSQQTLKDFVDPSTKLDGQFDFPLRKRLCDAVFARSMSLDSLFSWWNGNDSFYGAGALMSTWIGNHDIPRAIHFASGQITDCYQGSWVGNSWDPGAYAQPSEAAPYERLALAFGLLMTNRGVPLIYYGDEIGLAGGGDPDNRRMMPWGALGTHQEWLRSRVTRLAAIRASSVALRRGWRVTVTSGADTFAYKLTGCGPSEEVFVFANRGDGEAQVSGLPAGSYTELLTETPQTGGAAVSVPARGMKIFKAAP
jgi:glycosidase